MLLLGNSDSSGIDGGRNVSSSLVGNNQTADEAATFDGSDPGCFCMEDPYSVLNVMDNVCVTKLPCSSILGISVVFYDNLNIIGL